MRSDDGDSSAKARHGVFDVHRAVAMGACVGFSWHWVGSIVGAVCDALGTAGAVA